MCGSFHNCMHRLSNDTNDALCKDIRFTRELQDLCYKNYRIFIGDVREHRACESL